MTAETPTTESSDPGKPHPSWLLRRADQAAVATLTLVALAAMVGYWVVHGGIGGRLIEVDRTEPRSAQFKVDINSADWTEFAQLPNLGEIRARRIVSVREAGGPFVDFNDLQQRVRGIGPKTIEGIKPYLLPIPDTENIAGP